MEAKLHRSLRTRIFVTFMMLFTLFFATASVEAKNGHSTGSDSQAWIQMQYSNIPVTIWSGNASDKPGAIKGISYNEAANTLTLNNVDLPNWSLRTNEMGDDFKVKVTGSNSLGGIVVWGFGWGGNVEIIGNGTLELNKKKVMKAAFIMMAEGTEGRITIGPEVSVTAHAASNGSIWISGSKMKTAPINIRGKLAAPLALSKDSGKTTLEGWQYMGYKTEPTVYDWIYTNDVIKITPGAGAAQGSGKTCTVTFDANGGSKLSRKSISVASGKAVGTLPTTGRKDYAFKGWYTQKSGGSKVTSSTKITKGQTLYAQWTKVSVKQVSAPTVKKAGSGKMSVKIKKVSGVKGYQITYSTSSNFKGSKSVTTTSLNKTISKLEKGKTCYIRVRAYKTDSLKNKVYGKYSRTVKVKL